MGKLWCREFQAVCFVSLHYVNEIVLQLHFSLQVHEAEQTSFRWARDIQSCRDIQCNPNDQLISRNFLTLCCAWHVKKRLPLLNISLISAYTLLEGIQDIWFAMNFLEMTRVEIACGCNCKIYCSDGWQTHANEGLSLIVRSMLLQLPIQYQLGSAH